MAMGSQTICSTVMRGSSEPKGSWKMICMSRRRRRKSPPLARKTSWPSKDYFAGIRLDEPQQHAAQGALAGTGFAHQAQRLSSIDLRAKRL